MNSLVKDIVMVKIEAIVVVKVVKDPAALITVIPY